MHDHPDVLVVGLGPAGAAAAWAAASRGLSVVAVDRRRAFGEPVQCAEFVPMPMLKYTKSHGVLAQSIAGMKSFLPSGMVEESVFPGLMIDRCAFDRALVARAEEAGAEVYSHTTFASWNGSVAVLRHESERHTLRPRMLVGADGPHSPVAQVAGLPPQKVVFTRQYTVPLLKPYEDTDIFLSDDFPGGYGWLFPKGKVANLGLGADRAFADGMKLPLEKLHGQMIERGLLGETILGRTGGGIPVGGIRPMVHDRIVLVGDAAGLTHPITGAGIPAAVVSGEAAGFAVAEYLHGDGDALADYEEDMHDQFGPSLERAVARRKELEEVWHTPAAQTDAPMRRGWIAFKEYFGPI